MNKSIVLFVLIALFAVVSVQARRRLRYVETRRCPARSNFLGRGRWSFNERCARGSKLTYVEGKCRKGGVTFVEGRCGKGFTYVEGKCRRNNKNSLKGLIITETCRRKDGTIYTEGCNATPVKPTPKPKENFAEICPKAAPVRCPAARKCPVLLCKAKNRRPTYFTFRGKRCRGCDTCRTTKCENTKQVEERLRIVINKYKRKHALLRQVYYWLNKLERKLVTERSFFSKRIKSKHTTYMQWKKRVEKLRATYRSLKRQHSEAKTKVTRSHKNYKLIVKKLRLAKKRLTSLFAVYRKHLRTSQRLYKEYLASLKSSKFLKLQSELRLVSIMKSKLSWVERLVKKWIKIRTIHHNHYFLLEKVVVKPLVGGKCLCPVVYRPVCGAGGITYSSECVARCSGAKIEHQGACNCKPNPGVLQKIEDKKFEETKCRKEVSPGQFEEVACPEKEQAVKQDKQFEEVKCETRPDGTRTCA